MKQQEVNQELTSFVSGEGGKDKHFVISLGRFGCPKKKKVLLPLLREGTLEQVEHRTFVRVGYTS